MNPKRIIISRTDSIGDVVLTLPMAGVLKEKFPNCEILFLGSTYTKPVVELSEHIDRFINWDELKNQNNALKILKALEADVMLHVFPNKELAKLAHKAKIPFRIGTKGRLFHIFTCNKKVSFSRRKSNLHEAQLNIKLLKPLGIDKCFSLEELTEFYGLTKVKPLPERLQSLIDEDKKSIILHPKSKGSAKEWGLNNFKELITILPEKEFQIFISGTAEEGGLIGNSLPLDKYNVLSLLGKLSLDEFISFIAQTDGLVAASTGPLHISSALGKSALGLFSPKRPIHPGRWRPVGKRAKAIVFDENCKRCAEQKDCNCIQEIAPKKVAKILQLK